MSNKALFAGEWVTDVQTIVPGDTTGYRPLYAGPLTKGARAHVINVSSSDSSNRNGVLAYGKSRTLQTNTGGLTITGTNTITRISGSFITDGWRVGQVIIVYDPAAASHNVSAALSGVTATTLTVAGLTDETLTSACRLCHLVTLTTWNIPLSSGYATSVPSVALLDSSKIGSIDSQPGRFLTVGKSDVLYCAAGATLTASTRMEFVFMGGDFEAQA